MDLVIHRFINFLSLIILPLNSARITKGSSLFIDARRQAISRGAHNGIAFANFKAHKFSYLNITSLGTDYVVSGKECGIVCVNIPSCFSFNLAAFFDMNRGRILCELLPSDKYNNSDKFVASQSFHHFSIGSPCLSGPCQNSGTCLPLYEKNSYVCLCTKGTMGTNCETDIRDECTSNPCLNNATCRDLVNGFKCRCVPGYNGTQCETKILINDSAIISDNGFYLSKLKQFLAPAVGNHSEWLLCYRASTHGWTVRTFHSRCDGKYHTVTIIKNDQYVFGGYSDIPWDGSGSGYTTNAFIFSLRNKEGLGPFKSMVIQASYAIYRYSSYGPTFGWGWDIYIADNANSNTASYADFGEYGYYSLPSGVQDQYTILAGTRNFSPDEVEVFYLG